MMDSIQFELSSPFSQIDSGKAHNATIFFNAISTPDIPINSQTSQDRISQSSLDLLANVANSQEYVANNKSNQHYCHSMQEMIQSVKNNDLLQMQTDWTDQHLINENVFNKISSKKITSMPSSSSSSSLSFGKNYGHKMMEYSYNNHSHYNYSSNNQQHNIGKLPKCRDNNTGSCSSVGGGKPRSYTRKRFTSCSTNASTYESDSSSLDSHSTVQRDHSCSNDYVTKNRSQLKRNKIECNGFSSPIKNNQSTNKLKVMHRRERNREAAQRLRQKRKKEKESKESEIDILERKVMKDRKSLESMRKEYIKLYSRFDTIKDRLSFSERLLLEKSFNSVKMEIIVNNLP